MWNIGEHIFAGHILTGNQLYIVIERDDLQGRYRGDSVGRSDVKAELPLSQVMG